MYLEQHMTLRLCAVVRTRNALGQRRFILARNISYFQDPATPSYSRKFILPPGIVSTWSGANWANTYRDYFPTEQTSVRQLCRDNYRTRQLSGRVEEQNMNTITNQSFQ